VLSTDAWNHTVARRRPCRMRYYFGYRLPPERDPEYMVSGFPRSRGVLTRRRARLLHQHGHRPSMAGAGDDHSSSPHQLETGRNFIPGCHGIAGTHRQHEPAGRPGNIAPAQSDYFRRHERGHGTTDHRPCPASGQELADLTSTRLPSRINTGSRAELGTACSADDGAVEFRRKSS